MTNNSTSPSPTSASKKRYGTVKVPILIHFNIGMFDNFYRSFFFMKEANTFFLGTCCGRSSRSEVRICVPVTTRRQPTTPPDARKDAGPSRSTASASAWQGRDGVDGGTTPDTILLYPAPSRARDVTRASDGAVEVGKENWKTV